MTICTPVDAQRPNHYRIPAARLALIDTSLAPPKADDPIAPILWLQDQA